MAKNTHFISCSYDTETTPTRDYTYNVNSTYHVFSYSSYTLLVPRSYSYKKKGDAVTIEPPPPSPSTCRLCVRSSRTPFRLQARGDGTRMPSVLGESRASCRLSSWARSNSQTHRLTATVAAVQYEYTGIQAASQTSLTPDDGSHPPHHPSPMQ